MSENQTTQKDFKSQQEERRQRLIAEDEKMHEAEGDESPFPGKTQEADKPKKGARKTSPITKPY